MYLIHYSTVSDTSQRAPVSLRNDGTYQNCSESVATDFEKSHWSSTSDVLGTRQQVL